MRVLVKSALAAVALGVVGLVGVAALPANALPIKVSTNADIVCNEPSGIGGFKPPITTVSSGTGYAANTPVVVVEIISQDGKEWQGKKTDLTTSVNGSWSTPTTPYVTSQSGLYELNVTVTDPDGKITYGTAYDACKL